MITKETRTPRMSARKREAVVSWNRRLSTEAASLTMGQLDASLSALEAEYQVEPNRAKRAAMGRKMKVLRVERKMRLGDVGAIVAARLRQRRLSLGLTSKEVSIRAGVAYNTVCRLESGEVPYMKFWQIVAIADALNYTSMDWIFGRQASKTTSERTP